MNSTKITINVNSSSKSLIKQANELITIATIDRIRKRVNCFNSRTDVINFETALYSIRSMLDIIITENINDDELMRLCLTEFQMRVEEIDKILRKSRKERPKPRLTNRDKELLSEILDLCEQIYGKSINGQMGSEIFPYLLEAKGKEKYVE